MNTVVTMTVSGERNQEIGIGDTMRTLSSPTGNPKFTFVLA